VGKASASSSVLPAEGNNVILASLLVNTLLVLGKGITGVLFHSSALVSDACHSTTDVAAFFVNYRASNECRIYGQGDNLQRLGDKEKVAAIENFATFVTGLIFLTIGSAIYFHSGASIILLKFEKPEPITLAVAIIALVFYLSVYFYSRRARYQAKEYCRRITENSHWQNEMNLVVGSVVVAGLVGAHLGYDYLDEAAAVLVGTILFAMGIKQLALARADMQDRIGKYFKAAIVGAFAISITLSISAFWVGD
jgi:divalent metal cation (Fe/Co/Zn/Cd) transporter